ncbi:MAG TPA: Uma2 family endonuclease, partial [Armatimonadota bacterium]|nr:Uma2 family endonuclease [Armatimonadota bacterium]
VFEWLFHEQQWAVMGNVNLYSGRKGEGEEPLAPDVMVLKGYVLPEDLTRWPKSWSPSVPGWVPPAVAFEIASEKTWERDVDEKPARYAELEVKEYVYYDPRPLSEIPVRRRKGYRHFRMWKNVQGVAYEQAPDSRGWFWSGELDSWLVPDGAALQLYDPLGERRLTKAEAREMDAEIALKEAEAQRAEAETSRKETEAQRAEAEIARKEAEIARKEVEAQRAEAETSRKEAEAQRAEAQAEREARERAWAKLRELGIDPDTL